MARTLEPLPEKDFGYWEAEHLLNRAGFGGTPRQILALSNMGLKKAVDYLIETHYRMAARPMRMCQPRDLLLQVKNYCLYNELEPELTNEYFDFACENYFSVM